MDGKGEGVKNDFMIVSRMNFEFWFEAMAVRRILNRFKIYTTFMADSFLVAEA